MFGWVHKISSINVSIVDGSYFDINFFVHIVCSQNRILQSTLYVFQSPLAFGVINDQRDPSGWVVVGM